VVKWFDPIDARDPDPNLVIAPSNLTKQTTFRTALSMLQIVQANQPSLISADSSRSPASNRHANSAAHTLLGVFGSIHINLHIHSKRPRFNNPTLPIARKPADIGVSKDYNLLQQVLLQHPGYDTHFSHPTAHL
jgi:hypothetical protein